MKPSRVAILLVAIFLALSIALAQDQPGTNRFPSAPNSAASLIEAADNAKTVLRASLPANATSMTVVSTAAFPATGLLVIDGRSIVSYIGKTSTTFTGLAWSLYGTPALTFPAGVSVEMRVLAGEHNGLSLAIRAHETKIGYGASTPTLGKFLKGTGSGTSGWGFITAEDLTGALGSTPVTSANPTFTGTMTLPKIVIDSNGRTTLSGYVAAYNQASNVLSYAHQIALGTQTISTVSTERQLDGLRITGTISAATRPTGSATANMSGINFDMENDGDATGSSANDPVHLRGIIGEFRNGSTLGGSVRGMNLHAKALAGATGLTNAAAFAVTAVSATAFERARIIQLTSKGLTDKNVGIYFEQDSGINYSKGITFANAGFSIAPLYFANNQGFMAARNVENTADVPIMRLNTTNKLEVLTSAIVVSGADPYVQAGDVLFQQVTSGDGRLRFFIQNVGEAMSIDLNRNVKVQHDGLAATYANALNLTNATPATALVPLQQSPSMVWNGRFFNVGADAAIAARITLDGYDDDGVVPRLNIDFSNPNISSGAFINKAILDGNGKLTIVDLALTGLAGITLGATHLSATQLVVDGGSAVLPSGFNVVGPSIDVADLTFQVGTNKCLLQYYTNGFILDGTNAGVYQLTNGEFFKGVVPATGFTGDIFKIVDDAGSPVTKYRVLAQGAVQLGTYTTTERDALTAVNGMILYNSTTSKIQARAGGAWVDLH